MAQLGTGAGVGPNLDEQLAALKAVNEQRKKEAKEFEKQVDKSKVPIAEHQVLNLESATVSIHNWCLHSFQNFFVKFMNGNFI